MVVMTATLLFVAWGEWVVAATDYEVIAAPEVETELRRSEEHAPRARRHAAPRLIVSHPTAASEEPDPTARNEESDLQSELREHLEKMSELIDVEARQALLQEQGAALEFSNDELSATMAVVDDYAQALTDLTTDVDDSNLAVRHARLRQDFLESLSPKALFWLGRQGFLGTRGLAGARLTLVRRPHTGEVGVRAPHPTNPAFSDG